MDLFLPTREEYPELYEGASLTLDQQYSKIFGRNKLGNEANMAELAPTFIEVPVEDFRNCIRLRESKLPAYRRFKLGTSEMLYDYRKLERASSVEGVGLEYCLDAPVFTVRSKQEAKTIESDVLKTEICVVKGLAEIVGMDLRKFDSNVIVKTAPFATKIEVRYQEPQARCFNFDKTSKDPTWEVAGEEEHVYLENYVYYQSCQMNLEAKTPVWRDHDIPKFVKDGLIFGTNFDLDDPKIWKEQIKEVDKLPRWAAVAAKEFNFLPYYQDTVQGMNAIQMYLKVRQCRTPAHQENLNFGSVNINIGPGNTEWFAVDYGYWEIIWEMCKAKGIDFAAGSWWPDVLELQAAGIPVRRFTQKPGDLVYVNRGCIHWVQAESVCNNIAWNTGPLTSEQFRAALTRYEANVELKFKSIVPMRRLVWNFMLSYKDVNKLELQLRKDLAYVCAIILIEDLMIEQDIKRCLIFYLLEEDEELVSPEETESLKFDYERLSLEENLPVFRYCGDCDQEILSYFFILMDPNVKPSESFDNIIYCMGCVKKSREYQRHVRKEYSYLCQPSDEDYDVFCQKYETLRQGILVEEHRRSRSELMEVEVAAQESPLEPEVPSEKKK